MKLSFSQGSEIWKVLTIPDKEGWKQLAKKQNKYNGIMGFVKIDF